MLNTDSGMNLEVDIVISQDARGTQIPPDVGAPRNFEGESLAQIPPVAGTSGYCRVSETLSLAAGGFRGSFRQNVLRTTRYFQEPDNELRHIYPGQNEVREELLALATGACKLQCSEASEWRVHVILQKKIDPFLRDGNEEMTIVKKTKRRCFSDETECPLWYNRTLFLRFKLRQRDYETGPTPRVQRTPTQHPTTDDYGYYRSPRSTRSRLTTLPT